jgi:photosystem II stability/assembly factor-like uncharacterized protein
MKNFILLSIIFLITLFRAEAQNVPNGSFENWDTNKNGGSEPVGWQSLNESSFTNLFKVAGHSGESAAKLSVEFNPSAKTNVAPMFFLDNNFAISQRFTAFEFYLKGTATGGDYLSVSVGMYKGKTLIGYSIHQMNQTYAGWTHITMPIEYDSGEVPDECFIGIHIYPVMDSHMGTNYTIDDLALTSSSGSVPPVLLSAATNTTGNVLELTFSKPMADPAGKQNQFTFTRNGIAMGLTSAALKPGDSNTILLSPAAPVTAGDVLLISYIPGNISAASGEPLLSFSNLSVSNLTGSIQATSWQLVSSGVTDNLYSVHFANSTNGYVGGAGARCLKSTNSGLNWTSVNVPSNADFQAVWAVTPETVYLGAWDTVYYTNNGGTKWNGSFTNSFTLAVNDLQFLSSTNGYGFMSVSSFINTTNGGTNWAERTGSGVIEDYTAGYMLDQNTGFAVGNCSHIAKTTDGGRTWSVYEWNNWNNWTCTDIWGVHFATEQKGFAVADSGIVYSTANGGNSWSRKVIAGPDDRLTDVFFVNANKGWIVGHNGKIFGTTDGGNTWIQQPTITSNHLNGVFFISENLGWAVGNDGTILKYGGITTAAEHELFSGISNSVIFPNPSSGSCTLHCTVLHSGNVNIIITDITGRVVRTVYKGMLDQGNHSFDIELENSKNGIYFCRLVSGRETNSIKFIINR